MEVPRWYLTSLRRKEGVLRGVSVYLCDGWWRVPADLWCAYPDMDQSSFFFPYFSMR